MVALESAIYLSQKKQAVNFSHLLTGALLAAEDNVRVSVTVKDAGTDLDGALPAVNHHPGPDPLFVKNLCFHHQLCQAMRVICNNHIHLFLLNFLLLHAFLSLFLAVFFIIFINIDLKLHQLQNVNAILLQLDISFP